MAACVDALAPLVTATPRHRPASLRHEAGRSHLAMAINYWLRRSELSHDEMGRIAGWGLGEAGWLSSPQISHLRNRNLAKGASARNLEGLAGANRAIWLWHAKGPAAAIQELGPHSTWKVEAEALDGAIWLPRPADDTQPLTYGDFAELNAGLLTLPYLQDVNLSPTESVDLSSKLSELLNSLAGTGTAAEQIARVLKAYPIQDADRRHRLRDLMLGEPWTREELEGEMYALAATVNNLRCLQEGEYKPADLHAELSRHRRRV